MRGVVLGVLSLLASAAQADTSRILSDAEHRDWQAVGQINSAGYNRRSQCTGTLIAPDWVLTAAHCVDDHSDPSEVVFVAGLKRDRHGAVRRGAEIVIPPGHAADGNVDAKALQSDWALVRLADPINDITPVARGAFEADAPSRFIAYSNARPYALGVQGPCQTVSRFGALAFLDCPVASGNSGAALLQAEGEGWRIVGVVVARSPLANAQGVAVILDDEAFAAIGESAKR